MTTARKWTHPGNILLAGFGLLLVLMAALVYASIKQDIPMVSKHYYEMELQYQDRINAAANAADYSDQFRVSQTEQQVSLQLPTVLAAGMQSGSAYFYSPANDRLDKTLALSPSNNGLYSFNKADLPGKSYRLKVSLTSGGKEFYKEFNINW